MINANLQRRASQARAKRQRHGRKLMLFTVIMLAVSVTHEMLTRGHGNGKALLLERAQHL
ncbi:hypothetical protein BSK43_030230 [Rhizobium sp. P44RR-XXIV]|nr:hypothetical protein BSK43_030230 [Rhizobium sp. P44RR-XXIV]